MWYPYKKNIDKIESVQKRETILVPTLKDKSCEDRLMKLELPILRYRRSRRDLIETFMRMKGIYDEETCENL